MNIVHLSPISPHSIYSHFKSVKCLYLRYSDCDFNASFVENSMPSLYTAASGKSVYVLYANYVEICTASTCESILFFQINKMFVLRGFALRSDGLCCVVVVNATYKMFFSFPHFTFHISVRTKC